MASLTPPNNGPQPPKQNRDLVQLLLYCGYYFLAVDLLYADLLIRYPFGAAGQLAEQQNVHDIHAEGQRYDHP